VENRDATKRSTGPLRQISFELGMNRLKEWSHEGDLERRAGD
jgi:hypothetical protein